MLMSRSFCASSATSYKLVRQSQREFSIVAYLRFQFKVDNSAISVLVFTDIEKSCKSIPTVRKKLHCVQIPTCDIWSFKAKIKTS